jgi:type II secretory pathway component PulC
VQRSGEAAGVSRSVGIALALFVLVGCRRHEPPSATPEEAPRQTSAPATYDDATPKRGDAAAVVEPGADAPKQAKNRPPQTIFRSEIQRALAGGPAYLLRQLGPEPYRVEGRFIGWEITQLFPDDPALCDPCDLAVGDVILTINGDRLETPQAFASMVEKADTLRSLEVRSLRAEQRRIVKYEIVDD